MSLWFISDLHLSPLHPQVRDLFFKFLDQKVTADDTLYILGDFFDAWIGDDDNTPFNQQILNKLKNQTSAGTTIYFMHGNRDFLAKKQFEQKTGCQLIDEHHVIQIGQVPTLLMHGDLLCTEDIPYQTFRKQVRDPQYQQAFLQKPLPERQFMAEQLRAKSKAENELKADNIMDVTLEEVAKVMQRYQTPRLIHGHTHRIGIHQHQCGERIVLGDWRGYGNALKVTDGSYRFEYIH